jgi:hypothetical protein
MLGSDVSAGALLEESGLDGILFFGGLRDPNEI